MRIAVFVVALCLTLSLRVRAQEETPAVDPPVAAGPVVEAPVADEAVVEEAVVEEAVVEEEARDNEFKLGGRVITGFQVRSRVPSDDPNGARDTSYGFVLNQARLKAELRPNKRLRIVLSAEFSDGLDPADLSSPPYIRNAFLEFTVMKRWFEIRVGRFRRPFSRIAMRSQGDLSFRGRGLTNQVVSQDARWGNRALGAMLGGRIDPARLRWWLSASNPNWKATSEPDGLDLLARVEWDVNDAIEIGINGGHKWMQQAVGPAARALGFGADARARYEGFEFITEMLVAQNALVTTRPLAMGVLGTATYDISLSKNVRLQPVVFGEWVDADLEFGGTEAVRGLFGLNVLWKKSLRMMPQVELIRPLGDAVQPRNPGRKGECFMLIFSGQM